MSSVLLAEPSVPVAGALRRYLEGAGYEVSSAGGADEALRAVRARPPAVLLASATGTLDGEALCQALRAQGLAVPVLLLYPPTEDHAEARAAEAGADGCLVGPLKRANVLTCVALLMQREEARRQAVSALAPAAEEPPVLEGESWLEDSASEATAGAEAAPVEGDPWLDGSASEAASGAVPASSREESRGLEGSASEAALAAVPASAREASREPKGAPTDAASSFAPPGEARRPESASPGAASRVAFALAGSGEAVGPGNSAPQDAVSTSGQDVTSPAGAGAGAASGRMSASQRASGFAITPVPGTLTILEPEPRRPSRSDLPAIGASSSPDFEFLKRLMLMEVKRSRRYRYPIAVLLVELDRFSERSASLAPAARRAVLAEALGLLVAGVRDIDVAVPFADSRYVVFLPHTPRSGALVVAERLREKVKALLGLPGASASVGVAVSEPSATKGPPSGAGAQVSFGSLLKDAGEALRRAQAAGGDRVEPAGARPQPG